MQAERHAGAMSYRYTITDRSARVRWYRKQPGHGRQLTHPRGSWGHLMTQAEGIKEWRKQNILLAHFAGAAAEEEGEGPADDCGDDGPEEAEGWAYGGCND